MSQLSAWWNGSQNKELFSIAIKKQACKICSVLKTHDTPAPSGLSLHLLKIWPLLCYLILFFSAGYLSPSVSHSLWQQADHVALAAKPGTSSDPLYSFSSLSSDEFSALQKHLASLFLLNLNPLIRHWWIFLGGRLHSLLLDFRM